MADDGTDLTTTGEWGASWEANRRRELTMGLDATPARRLAWLEEAIALAHLTGALPRPHAGGTASR